MDFYSLGERWGAVCQGLGAAPQHRIFENQCKTFGDHGNLEISMEMEAVCSGLGVESQDMNIEKL